MLTDDAKAVIALTTRLGSSPRPSLSPSRWHDLSAALRSADRRPADLFDRGLALGEIPGVASDLAERVGALLSDAAATTLEADELSRKGIWVLTVVDPGYPMVVTDRLGSNAPPVIFGAGEAGLLSGEGVGIVGSRDVDEEAAEVAKGTARAAVALGRAVVSGGARGIDQLAMNSAHSEGGAVVGVLADSLLTRIKRPDILTALDQGMTTLITQQSPSTEFSAAAAMARNKLVYALARVTVVVASADGTGGTWAGATEAIRSGSGVVAVWRGPGEGRGNAALQAQGAVPLTSVDDLERLLSTEPKSPAEQLSLY